jgi:hypothetical protein
MVMSYFLVNRNGRISPPALRPRIGESTPNPGLATAAKRAMCVGHQGGSFYAGSTAALRLALRAVVGFPPLSANQQVAPEPKLRPLTVSTSNAEGSREFKSPSLHHPDRQFSDLSENRSKSARVRAICNHAWTRRTPSAARIRRIQILFGENFQQGQLQ